MPSNSVNLGISIPMEMYQWLERPENKKRINRSQLFQNAVNDIKCPQKKKMSPMSFLVIIMGMAFGVGCIIFALQFIFDFMFNTTLFLLGAVVMLASIVTMIKESRRTYASRIL